MDFFNNILPFIALGIFIILVVILMLSSKNGWAVYNWMPMLIIDHAIIFMCCAMTSGMLMNDITKDIWYLPILVFVPAALVVTVIYIVKFKE